MEGSGNGASLVILCGTEEEASTHVLCECVRPWLHSDMHIWDPSFCTLRIL